ncbi:MAG: FHIPEP family type III secretion protein, partial [Actinomycetota bacterium]|nr:FHIPEP family type III secretion protein [Actinomycetota bacterium]
GIIPVITLARPAEDAIRNSIQHKETGSYLAIDPIIAQRILDSIGKAITMFEGGSRPVLLSAPQIRPYVRSLTERYYPALAIISHNEVTPNLKVRSLGTVTLEARITSDVTLWVNGYHEAQPRYTWTGPPVTYVTGELAVVNTNR